MNNTIHHHTYPLSRNRLRLARIATFFGFFQLGSVMLMWSTGVSSLRIFQGWDGPAGDASFGLLATSIGTGAALGCMTIGPLVDRFGPKRVARPLLVMYPLSYIPLAFLEGLAQAMACGLLIGLLRGTFNTTINTHGVHLERHYGRPLLSGFNAAYPAGGFITGFVGSALAQRFTDSPAVAFTAIGVTVAIIGLVVGRWLLDKDDTLPADVRHPHQRIPSKSAPQRRGFAAVMMLTSISALYLASIFSENSALDWGQEFARRTLGTSAGVAGAAVSVYAASQFISRVFGDRITDRVGERVMLAVSGLVGAGGALLITFAHVLPLVFAGFSMLGLGLGCMAPLMISTAGRIDPARIGRNIGIVNGIGHAGFLVGPAVLSLVATTLGISWVFLVPVVLLLLIAVGGPLLMRLAPQRPQGTAGGDRRNVASARG